MNLCLAMQGLKLNNYFKFIAIIILLPEGSKDFKKQTNFKNLKIAGFRAVRQIIHYTTPLNCCQTFLFLITFPLLIITNFIFCNDNHNMNNV